LAVAFAPTAETRQTIKVNPTQAVFTASPDHASVTSYVLEIDRFADGSVVRTTDVGKPTPNGQNDITVALTKTGLSNNVNYVFNIIAVGPGGSTRSATPSNPFAWADAPAPASNLRAQ
jgi:hypothetical protein